MYRFIGNQFRKPTGFFGRIISGLMKTGNRSIYEKLIPEMMIQPQDKIFEIGYGHGLGVDRIASGFDCYITGIDFSELMFREATQRNQKHIDQQKVVLYFGDFLGAEMVSNLYDKIFCINVIYFWDRLEEPFFKIWSGLKEGGLFCLYMARSKDLEKLKFTKDDIFHRYSIEQVVDQLKSAGFGDIQYHDDHGYYIRCKK